MDNKMLLVHIGDSSILLLKDSWQMSTHSLGMPSFLMKNPLLFMR